ncbi:MAG: hypothetical protein INR73_19075 [Williamsia sp.]|nr:hypothetical protein [Williamsia sp.]
MSYQFNVKKSYPIIDGIKIRASITPELKTALIKKFQWNVTHVLVEGTMQQLKAFNMRYKNMLFKLYETEKSTILQVSGSINSYYNGNNSKNLNYSDLKAAIASLCEEIGIEPQNAKPINFELGCVIITTLDPSKIVKQMVSIKHAIPSKTNSNRGTLREFEFDEFYLKAYDRGKWLDLQEQLLALELKFTTYRSIAKHGIFTLADFNKKNLRSMAKFFLQTYKQLIIVDPRLYNSGLSKCRSSFVYQISCPEQWEEINKDKRNNWKSKYKQLLAEYLPFPSIHEEIMHSLKLEVSRFFGDNIFDDLTFNEKPDQLAL